LDGILPSFEEKTNDERQVRERLQLCEQRLTELYAKQNRSTQFSSKRERDSFLKTQIAESKVSLADEVKQVSYF